MPFLDISGVSLHYQTVEGDPSRRWLVFLHEGLGSIELWRGFPERIATATGNPTLVYSRHGHGWSDPLRGPRSPTFLHDEALLTLPALLDALSIESPILVGHSDGASIALIHAGAGPRPVAALVALAPHVFVEPEALVSVTAARESFESTDMAARMTKYHHDPESTFFGWHDIWQSAEFRQWNIEGVLGAIDPPLLVVQGADDEYGTHAQIDAIASGVPQTIERLWLEGCGHSPHLDFPQEVFEALVVFIERHGSIPVPND